MTRETRTFEDHSAERSHVPLLVGIMGASNSGKTYSALRLATGIQSVSGGDIFVIDTESKRALHYADSFKFRHIDFEPPFGSLDYLAALQHCAAKSAGVIIVDSQSHEHIGPGGYLLTQDAEVDRMAGGDLAKRDRVKMAGWIKPASLRQQLITGLLQINCNFIFCFRAKEKTKPVPGKQPVEMGFMPIAGEEFLFEMTVNCLLMPKSDGVPTWRSDQIGERLMMKLPIQFQSIFADSAPLSEDIGRQMAEWARGGAPTADLSTSPSAAALPALVEAGDAVAKDGMIPLAQWWKVTLTAAERKALGQERLEAWKTAASAEASSEFPGDQG